jgi:hypothetical protein
MFSGVSKSGALTRSTGAMISALEIYDNMRRITIIVLNKVPFGFVHRLARAAVSKCRFSLGSTRSISVMGFLGSLKPISKISLGLSLLIRGSSGSPDSPASAFKCWL